MRALLFAALVSLWAQHCFGFFFISSGSYREARQNYYEVMTNCEREGGECLDVDFGTPDPPTQPPTPAPTTTPRPRPTTRAPLPPVTPPWFQWHPFWPFVPTTRAPIPTTRAPRPTTPAPSSTTQVPPLKPAKKLKIKRSRKVGKAKRRKQNRNNGEQERELRKRRQAFNPDPWDYLYNECTGGWEFDFGCGARGGNVCCYSSNSNSHR